MCIYQSDRHRHRINEWKKAIDTYRYKYFMRFNIKIRATTIQFRLSKAIVNWKMLFELDYEIAFNSV